MATTAGNSNDAGSDPRWRGSSPEPIDDDCELSDPEAARVAAAMKLYLARIEQGMVPDREEFLREHAEIAEALEKCLFSLEFLRSEAKSLGGSDATEFDRSRQAHRRESLGHAVPVELTGRTLGDFFIERLLGSGGMGIVYLATQQSLGRRVALKIMPLAALLDHKQVQRFKNEALAVAGLEHPHIVPVYAVGSEEGLPYYAMQYIDGQNLNDLIHAYRSDPQPSDPEPVALRGMLGEYRSREYFVAAAELARQAAEAIDYAHQSGVIHRDIKPSNLMIDRDAKVWITDFGLAMTQADRGLTAAGELVGTLRYMSPEQARGDRRVLNHRTDIYSLGAALYELLTLKPLFAGDQREKLLHDVMEVEPQAPRKIEPAVPHDLETVVLKAISKDPADRYVTAQEFAEDLRRFQSGLPVSAYRASRITRIRRWCGRNRVLTAVTVALILSLTIGTIVSTILGMRAQSESAVSRQRLIETRQMLYGMGLQRVEQVQTLAPAKALALLLDEEICPPEMREFTWRHFVWRNRRCRLTSESNATIHDLVFVPNRPRVLTAGSDGWIISWNVNTGRQVTAWQAHDEACLALALTSDGETLVSAGEDRRLRIWSMVEDQGEPVAVGEYELRCETARNLLLLQDHSLLVADSNTTAAWYDLKEGRQSTSIDSIANLPGTWGATADGRQLAFLDASLSPTVAHTSDNAAWETTTLDHAGNATVVSVSLRGDLLAVGDATGNVVLYFGDEFQYTTEFVAHDRPITSIAFSLDGTRLATGNDRGEVKVWPIHADHSTGIPMNLSGDGATVSCMTFGPRSESLAVTSLDGTWRLWDVRLHDSSEEGPNDVVDALAVSRDNSFFASGSEQGVIRLWRMRDGTPLRMVTREAHRIKCIAVSPDGARLASAGEDGVVWVWDTQSGERVLECRGHQAGINGIAYSPDGRRLATASDDETVRIWDANLGTEKHVLIGHNDQVAAVTFSPDGASLASAGRDATAHVWRVVDGSVQMVLAGHLDGVNAVAYSPDGRILATAGTEKDATIRLWDTQDWRPLKTLTGHADAIYAVAFSPDGRTLASAGKGRVIKLWDMQSYLELASLRGHDDWVSSLVFSHDGQALLSAGSDSAIRIWRADNVSTADVAHSIASPDDDALELQRRVLPWDRDIPWFTPSPAVARIVSLPDTIAPPQACLMPDAQRVAIGKPDGSIQVWPVTIASVEPLLQLHSATPGLRSLNASANSRYLASLDEDGVALVWDLQIGQQMARVPAQPSCTEALVSPAGDRLVTLGREPTIAVWEIPSGKLMQSWDGPAQPLRAMQTRQDGWVVADQTLQQIFRIDLAQLEHAPQPLGATSRLHGGACVLSPQGDRLAVVGNWYYEAVAVRPVSDPAKTTFLGGHLSGALQAQWLDETRLVTAGFDGTLRIWNADSRQQLAVLSVDQLELRGFVIAADQSQLVSWHANPGERSSFVTWDLTTILGTEPSSP